MKAMEEELPASLFVRIHRSYILSLDALKTLKGNVVETEIGELPIGLQYKENLMRRVFGKK